MKRRKSKAGAVGAADLACRYGNVSIGPERCSIGVTVSRARIDAPRLEPIVVGARLSVDLAWDPCGDADVAGQKKMLDTAVRISGVADCPSLSIRPEKLSFRLAFSAHEADLLSLARIAQKEGTITMERTGSADDNGEKEGDE